MFSVFLLGHEFEVQQLSRDFRRALRCDRTYYLEREIAFASLENYQTGDSGKRSGKHFLAPGWLVNDETWHVDDLTYVVKPKWSKSC